MRIAEYTSGDFGALGQLVERVEGRSPTLASLSGKRCSLAHRPFVDHYYATRDNCRLYMLLSEREVVQAVLGVEQMPFEAGGGQWGPRRKMMLGFGTNFFSFLPGAGGYLFLHWLKTVPIGLAFGASADGLRVMRGQKWTFFEGARTLHLNAPVVEHETDGRWRRAAKRLWKMRRRPLLPRLAGRLERAAGAGISVREETAYSEELLSRGGEFAFRFAPDVSYLEWRYNLNVPFVRYRLYRILRRGGTCGYVILNDLRDRLMVAHCDGEDAEAIVSGVLLSVVDASRGDTEPREVMLASSHKGMQGAYRRAGFRMSKADRPLVLGSRSQGIDVPGDTSEWLINFDWGDNGLRGPFRDQVGAVGARVACRV